MTETKTNSTHRVEVVPVALEKHPNADALSIVRVFGYPVVVRTEDWQGEAVGAYVPPDSLVPISHPYFYFLAHDANAEGYVRVRAKKFRGVQSFGLLVPAVCQTCDGTGEVHSHNPRCWTCGGSGRYPVGDDVAEVLGVKHYEPPIKGEPGIAGVNLGGQAAPAPPVAAPKYDVEAGRRYADGVFVPDEPVLITEKIHGANARYVFSDGRMHCGSRTEWKKEREDYSHITAGYLRDKGVADDRIDEILAHIKQRETGGKKNWWWQALDNHPELREFCINHPDTVVYGEVYGPPVQDLTYGVPAGEVRFVAFDLLQGGRWATAVMTRALLDVCMVPQVPMVACELYNFDSVCRHAEGKSLMPGADHIREGVVVKPVSSERWDDAIGRVQLKWVSAAYLERK